jgi:small subunit ribosomal protein S17
MKQMTGTVVSTKNAQTAIVEVTRKWKHPLYGKIVSRTKKFPCHIPTGKSVEVGAEIVMQESRPISKTKHFILLESVKE